MLDARKGIDPEYASAKQISVLTGYSEKALETMRARKRGPPWIRVGCRIRYRICDVRRWIEEGGGAG
jgi:hypothetical protein